MSESALLIVTLLMGITVVLAILIKAALERVAIPALVGYLALGLGIQALLSQLLQQGGEGIEAVLEIYGFLGELGLIALLFRVGLESNLAGLLRQLPRASVILVGDVLISGILSFLVAHDVLGWSLISSLILSIAFVATSVGISVSVWQEANALNSRNGELLLDVAELDDIAAIAGMSLLFELVPVFIHPGTTSLSLAVGKAVGIFALKVLLFTMFCLVFSTYCERSLTSFFKAIEPAPDPMLMIAGTGFIIAALAGLAGFSAAVGAFFAGLVFSRDPEAVKLDASFGTLYEFFVPFFFVNIGLTLDINALPEAVGLGLLFGAIAILGKLIGTGGLTLLTAGGVSAGLLGISMIPRAEITLVVLQRGRDLGSWAVSEQVFAAMTVMCVLTCILPPLLLRPMLRRWPQTQEI